MDAASNKSPDQEHVVMPWNPDCTAIVLDPMSSPASAHLPGRDIADLPFVGV